MEEISAEQCSQLIILFSRDMYRAVIMMGKAACNQCSFITAYKHNIVSVMETHCLQIIENFTVMCVNFLGIFSLLFLICMR